MRNTFTAIDFETAQPQHWSICQVGLVRVENGVVKKTINKLVCPPDNYYWDKFIDIHGITPDHTCDAPNFLAIWSEIKDFIEKQTVVAHNGAFDFSCLAKTLEYYGQRPPEFEKQCTYKIYGKRLNVLCQEFGIDLKHHDALSDARACAELYGRYLKCETTEVN